MSSLVRIVECSKLVDHSVARSSLTQSPASKSLEVCWLIVWALWHINLCRLFNAKRDFYTNSSISNNSISHKYTVQVSKTFLIQAIRFIQTVLIQLSISTDLFTHT